MNISKAKTVMIIVFLGLNIFLAYQIIIPGWGITGDIVFLEEIQRMENMIKDSNYLMEANIPRKPEKSFFLTVKAQSRDLEELKKLFFNKSQAVLSETDEKMVLESEKVVVHVFRNGFLNYYKKDAPADLNEGKSDTLNEQGALDKTIIFLKEKNFLPEEPYRYEIIEDVNGFQITFFQEYAEIPVYSGYVTVLIKNTEIQEVEVRTHNIIGTEDRQEMKVIPATLAVMRLLEETGVAVTERTIKKIDAGFYSREYNAEQWEIPPVWRVVIDDGITYYINAFTGNIEYEETGRKI